LTFRGTNNLALNGATTLNTGATTITVEAPQMTVSLGGVISGTDGTSALIKAGLGTLVLANNNLFTGGLTVSAGTLALAGLNAGTTAPVPMGSTVTLSNTGLLSLQNNGASGNGIITYANDITVDPLVSTVGLNVGNNGANLNNVVEVPN